MNSSLLVPGLIAVAVTAGIFVFGDGLFSDGSSSKAKNYQAVSKSSDTENDTEVAVVGDVKASTSTGSDFSWDEDASEPAQSPVQRPVESFVSTKPTEEAPGELYGSDFDSPSDQSFDSVDEFAKKDLGSKNLGSSERSTNVNVDDSKPAVDLQAASKQVDDDLSSFFDMPSKSSEASTARKAVAKNEPAPSASTSTSFDEADLDVALASPKSSRSSVDAFDNFGPAPSDFGATESTTANTAMKSVVAPEVTEPAAKKTNITKSDIGSEISGALEPVNDNHFSAKGSSKNGVAANANLRKFKITNPKETTLPVTLNVDGKQVTLKPDQSYVIKQSDDDVTVTFSRGGSFGFETKKLKKGQYRFTVSREAGWQLIN